jgi:hypothetical protein
MGMIVIGPLLGIVLALGLGGLVAGRLVGNVILRRAARPARAGRIAAWCWSAIFAAAGLGLAYAALSIAPADPLDPAIAAFYLWIFGVNGITGSLAIRARVGHGHEAF